MSEIHWAGHYDGIMQYHWNVWAPLDERPDVTPWGDEITWCCADHGLTEPMPDAEDFYRPLGTHVYHYPTDLVKSIDSHPMPE